MLPLSGECLERHAQKSCALSTSPLVEARVAVPKGRGEPRGATRTLLQEHEEKEAPQHGSRKTHDGTEAASQREGERERGICNHS